ncbi:MAG: ABC transporter ATP-binding protein [Lachnospiraceae bacterium]|nr:ABC transporter ATP-binding protein [Lachnospiraceae bacterium]
MEYVLTTDALSKQYGHFKVLSGLNLHIPEGAIYGLVGKNGAGKTTFIRLICGMQRPTSGSYSLYGTAGGNREIARVRRRMGAVVETPSLYLDMSAAQNLEMQYRILGLPSFEGIAELLDLVGLADTGKKKAKHFSLGMKQRLGIAIALAGEPDFLVLDEPVNGLDPQGIVEIRELILKLNRQRGITVLISSHILDELAKLATHYGFLDGGRMVREVSAAELEAACRKCIRVTVTDTAALACLLDERKVEYRILSGQEADIYAKLDISELVMALAGKGCKVVSMQERDESLESYYISLVGGRAQESTQGGKEALPQKGTLHE